MTFSILSFYLFLFKTTMNIFFLIILVFLLGCKNSAKIANDADTTLSKSQLNFYVDTTAYKQASDTGLSTMPIASQQIFYLPSNLKSLVSNEIKYTATQNLETETLTLDSYFTYLGANIADAFFYYFNKDSVLLQNAVSKVNSLISKQGIFFTFDLKNYDFLRQVDSFFVFSENFNRDNFPFLLNGFYSQIFLNFINNYSQIQQTPDLIDLMNNTCEAYKQYLNEYLLDLVDFDQSLKIQNIITEQDEMLEILQKKQNNSLTQPDVMKLRQILNEKVKNLRMNINQRISKKLEVNN